MLSKIFKKMQSRPAAAKTDILLLGVTLALITFGTVMIYSSSSLLALDKFKDGEFFIKKQFYFLILGMIVMTLASKINYSVWSVLAYPALVTSCILLALLFIPGFGVRAGGATRWLKLGGVTFQVVEVVKVGLVIFLAHYLSEHWKKLENLGAPFFISLAAAGLLAAMIYLQPDYGSATLVVVITILMLFLAGIKIKYVVIMGIIFLPVMAGLLLLKGYRVERLMTFLDPWRDPLKSGFQIIQSFISFGSGGATGVGLGGGMQKLFYLPEAHTDFILAIIAEESGLIGVIMVIALYAILIYRGLAIAYRVDDFFGYLLAAGLTLLLAFGVAINILGVMGIIPLKGMALPFLSYGGTSLIVSMAAVGILLNVSSHCRR